MKVYFSTPGPLDPRAFTTFGLNAKLDEQSAIGYFGTGLKYALAILAREGANVTINGSLLKVENTSFRGKAFKEIFLGQQSLPFTTELGKNWTIDMAFRELYSNTLDEKGLVGTAPGPFETNIMVEHPDFYKAYLQKDTWFLRPGRRVVAATPRMEVIEGQSNFIYFKGVRVGQPTHLCQYTYNFTYGVQLSEDRTANLYTLGHLFGDEVTKLTDAELIKELITMPEKTFETSDGSYLYITDNSVSNEFRRAAMDLRKTSNLHPDVRQLLNRWKQDQLSADDAIALLPHEQEMLQAARAWLAKAGHHITIPIYKIEGQADNVVGSYLKGQIFLTKEAFTSVGELIDTLLHEQAHHISGAKDCTRAFEEYLLKLAIKEMEKRVGVPQ